MDNAIYKVIHNKVLNARWFRLTVASILMMFGLSYAENRADTTAIAPSSASAMTTTQTGKDKEAVTSEKQQALSSADRSQAAKALEAAVRQLQKQNISEGALGADTPMGSDANEDTEVALTRSNEPRQGEASYAKVPDSHTRYKAYEKFVALKSQVENGVSYAEVLRQMSEFVDAYPMLREARITYSRLLIIDDQPRLALDALAPLLVNAERNAHPDWQPWFWAGTAQLAMGDVAGAQDNLDVAITKNGGVAGVWIQLAVLEQEQNNHAGALQYVAIAEQLAPNSGEVHLNKAYSLEHLGRYQEAMSAYQQFLISDMNPSMRAVRPRVLRRIAEIAQAVQLASAN